MSDQQYHHPDLKRFYLTPDNYDFALYTDGAGYTDPFGGHAVIGVSVKYHKFFTRAAAVYGTNTERQEFEALLNGLQGILDAMDWNSKMQREALSRKPPTVFWLSDRENLVGSVRRDEQGKPIFKRSTQPDLWPRFEFYESLFNITAVHRNRNIDPFQAVTDEISSECRVLMKHADIARKWTQRISVECLETMKNYIAIREKDKTI